MNQNVNSNILLYVSKRNQNINSNILILTFVVGWIVGIECIYMTVEAVAWSYLLFYVLGLV